MSSPKQVMVTVYFRTRRQATDGVVEFMKYLRRAALDFTCSESSEFTVEGAVDFPASSYRGPDGRAPMSQSTKQKISERQKAAHARKRQQQQNGHEPSDPKRRHHSAEGSRSDILLKNIDVGQQFKVEDADDVLVANGFAADSCSSLLSRLVRQGILIKLPEPRHYERVK